MDKDQNLNLKIENKEVAQFTGMARAQMFFETVMSFFKNVIGHSYCWSNTRWHRLFCLEYLPRQHST
jgi:hypothetical protein